MFTPLITEQDIKKAYDVYARSMTSGGQKVTQHVGFHGGGSEAVVNWYPALKLWTHFSSVTVGEDYPRYWCAYGVEDPEAAPSLSITVEINIPVSGINRRVAAVFVKDEDGNIYIAHSGKVGGGREGISKSAFWEAFKGHDQVVEVTWPDRRVPTKAILLGRIDSPEFPAQIADFVHQIDAFKKSVVSGKSPQRRMPTRQALQNEEDSFTPEFTGQKDRYTQAEITQAHCNHGLVINALQAALAARGIESFNDSQRDLYVKDNSGKTTILFEAKTELSTTSIYQAIGQLMYHGAVQDPPPRRVLVLPGKPKNSTPQVLSRLGIEVLMYTLTSGRVAFEGLDTLLQIQS